MTWEWHSFGLKTDIPIPKSSDSEEEFYKFHEIRAISLPDNKAKLELVLLRTSMDQEAETGLIIPRLQKLHDNIRYADGGYTNVPFVRAYRKGDYDNTFIVEFPLENEDQFCNAAIAFLRQLFLAFNIDSRNGYLLADFKLRHDDFVEFEKGWISLVRGVRIENQLPAEIWSDEDIPLAS
jgi:hypothetical protein